MRDWTILYLVREGQIRKADMPRVFRNLLIFAREAGLLIRLCVRALTGNVF